MLSITLLISHGNVVAVLNSISSPTPKSGKQHQQKIYVYSGQHREQSLLSLNEIPLR